MLNIISLSLIIINWLCIVLVYDKESIQPMAYARTIIGCGFLLFVNGVFPGANVLSVACLLYAIFCIICDVSNLIDYKITKWQVIKHNKEEEE